MGVRRKNIVNDISSENTRFRTASQLPGIHADLARVVHKNTRKCDVRMIDNPPKRCSSHRTGCPLDGANHWILRMRSTFCLASPWLLFLLKIMASLAVVDKDDMRP